MELVATEPPIARCSNDTTRLLWNNATIADDAITLFTPHSGVDKSLVKHMPLLMNQIGGSRSLTAASRGGYLIVFAALPAVRLLLLLAPARLSMLCSL